MKTILTWLIRIVVIVVAVKAALWAWDRYRITAPVAESEVIDSDKVCRILSADTGQCLCRHRLTNELLDITKQECHKLAR